MPDLLTRPDSTSAASRPLGPSLSPAVWIATGLAFLSCLHGLTVGVLLVIQAAGGSVRPPETLLSPFFDPLRAGLLILLLSCLVAWCQYLAAFRRRVRRSYLVAVLFFLLGLVSALGPWDIIQDLKAGAYLFIGIVMWRWGRRMAMRETGAVS